jgi:pantothenate kinase type III
LTKVLTGGGVPRLRDHLPAAWRFAPHLVHLGLYRIWSLRQR